MERLQKLLRFNSHVSLGKIATGKTIKPKQSFKIPFERKCLMFGVKIKQTEDLFESAGLQRSGRYLRSNVSKAEVD